MARVLVYTVATGRIEHIVTCPADMVDAQAGHGQAAVETLSGDGGTLWYFVDGALTLRPALAFDRYVIAADDTDTATLELPGSFTALIDGAPFELEDVLEITSDMPARYRVVIDDNFPYLDLDVEIVAE